MATLFCIHEDEHAQRQYGGAASPVHTIYRGDALCLQCFHEAVKTVQKGLMTNTDITITNIDV